jgi:hypothetical protein
MSIQNAINFTEIYQNEEKLRSYLSSLSSPEEVRSYLKELDLEFTDEEFEEGYNLQVGKCKDEVHHNILSQVKLSYIYLVREVK